MAAEVPASQIEWQRLLGTSEDGTLYSLAGRGFLGIPFLASPELDDGIEEFIRTWLEEHPHAVVVPVESYPLLSESAPFVYAWVIGDRAHLNLELVEKGYCRASLMVPLLRAEDRLVGEEQVDVFLTRISQAERRAATAGTGIWQSASPDKVASAGDIPPPGRRALSEVIAEARAADAEATPPAPTYDARTPEDELIRLADGADSAASYAALEELLRRALTESLSDAAFASLIERGLERQADVALDWRGHYGWLLQVAYDQGRLSEADFRQYASAFFHLELAAAYHPPAILELRGEHRGGPLRDFDGTWIPTIPVFAMVYVRDVSLDGSPVAMLEADRPQAEIVLFHDGNGTGTAAGRRIQLGTEDSLLPGTHVLMGRVEIVVRRGAHSWRDGAIEQAPRILSREESFRATFEVPGR